MSLAGRLLLETAAVLISLGGLYDLFPPKLPPNLAAICAGSDQAVRLARELLRALGGALVAVGVAVFVLVITAGNPISRRVLAVVLLLVLPAEGVNAYCMRRVGSPFQIPVAFILLTLLGTGLSFAQSF